jgi:endonuclease/exonuclease/phosphatase family metal-dependent hydrolase
MANMGLARPIGYHPVMKMIVKRLFRLILGLVALLTLVACALHISNSGDDPVPEPVPGALRVATYNVHYIVMRAETGPWSVGDWERRKGPLDDAFKTVDADVIGFQEMESFGGGNQSGINLTLEHLIGRNPGYAAAAVGDPAEFPSTQPILYRTDRLSLVDQGWFFFSDTPDVIYSRTFNGSYPAFASWARFREVDGAEFLVMNVHFEYSSASNRLLSAELVVDRLQPFLEEGLPVILLGDLNARLGSRTHEILAGAGLDFAPVEGATYHFDRGINLFGAIDHIGVTPQLAFAGEPAILRQQFRDEWPTDHYPVLVDITLPH